jgi:Fe-S oxidoreductase
VPPACDPFRLTGEVGKNDASFNIGRPVGLIHAEDAVHVPGEVQHDARTDGVAGHRCSSAPADQGRFRFPAGCDDGYDVVHGAWEDDGEGRYPADAVLFVDSFTKGFRPEVAGAAARVMESTGRTVGCEAGVCCGLTWISTGQLDTAKKLMGKAVAKLDDGTDAPIVVIEPSCAAALKKDAPELLGTEAAERVSHRIRSFAEAVKEWVDAGWTPPTVPTDVTVQTHCHEYSTFGATVQRKALAAIGVANVTEATGCCGVAGNFGFEANHYDISMKVAEQALAPALAKTAQDAPVLADGFSCAMQVKQLEPERKSLHLAELLDPQSTHHTEG